MNTLFPEYKGLNLPDIAKNMLDYWKTQSIFKKSIRETFINLKSQYKNTRNPTHQEVFYFKL